MVTMLASSFCADSESEFSTPHSRSRLPNIKKPTRATDLGATRPAMSVMRIGKQMRVVLEIEAGLYSILMRRSFFVVMQRMTAGCTMGTSAIYE